MKMIAVGIAFHVRDEDYARQLAEAIRAAVAKDGIEASVRIILYHAAKQ